MRVLKNALIARTPTTQCSRELAKCCLTGQQSGGIQREPQRGPHLFNLPHWIQALLGVKAFYRVLEFCTYTLPLPGPETTAIIPTILSSFCLSL